MHDVVSAITNGIGRRVEVEIGREGIGERIKRMNADGKGKRAEQKRTQGVGKRTKATSTNGQGEPRIDDVVLELLSL